VKRRGASCTIALDGIIEDWKTLLDYIPTETDIIFSKFDIEATILVRSIFKIYEIFPLEEYCPKYRSFRLGRMYNIARFNTVEEAILFKLSL
jgi:hypothetical protein